MAVAVTQETPELRATAILQLKSLLSADSYLVTAYPHILARPDCDAFLLRFIRARKFDVKRAAELVHNFAEWTWQYSLTNLDLSVRRDSVLPGPAALGVYENPGPQFRDHEGRQLLFMRMGRGQPWVYTPEQMLPVWFGVMESVLQYEHTQTHGLCIVGITEGVERKHFDRKLVQLVTSGVQKRMPLRMGRMIMCRPPAFFRIIFPIVRAFISEKMASRFVLAPDPVNQLPEYMPKQNVPPEYNGMTKLAYIPDVVKELPMGPVPEGEVVDILEL